MLLLPNSPSSKAATSPPQGVTHQATARCALSRSKPFQLLSVLLVEMRSHAGQLLNPVFLSDAQTALCPPFKQVFEGPMPWLDSSPTSFLADWLLQFDQKHSTRLYLNVIDPFEALKCIQMYTKVHHQKWAKTCNASNIIHKWSNMQKQANSSCPQYPSLQVTHQVPQPAQAALSPHKNTETQQTH